MHLEAIEWNYAKENNTNSFLQWVKENVVAGYPVAIGIYMNQYRFYHNTNPRAGSDYDHIIPITGNDFNAHAAQASQSWTIQISAGNNWVMTQNILSDEIAAYRAVPVSGP